MSALIAIYLPQDQKLFFDKENATLTFTSHKHYCIQSRNKVCRFANTIFSINQLMQIAPWIAPPVTTEPINNSGCQGYTKQNLVSSEEPSNHGQDEMVTGRVDIEDESDKFVDIEEANYCDHTRAYTSSNYQIKGSSWKAEQPSIRQSR